MNQKVYRVKTQGDFYTTFTLTLIPEDGGKAGPDIEVTAGMGEDDQAPRAIIDALKERGERFVGSMPGTGRHEAWYIITEPIEEEKRLVDIGAEMDRRNI